MYYQTQSKSLSYGLWILDFGFGTWIWDLNLGFGFGTWIWDLDLGLGFGTGLGLDNKIFEMLQNI